MLSLKKTFSELLPKKDILKISFSKRHFRNCSLKKDILEIGLLKKAFLKYILKIALSKLLSKKNVFFKIDPFKNTFLNLLSQKRHFENTFQNYSLKKNIFKLTFSENNNLIVLINSSSDSSEQEKSFKLSLMCLITFFSMCYTLWKTLADNSFHLFKEHNPSLLLLNKYD